MTEAEADQINCAAEFLPQTTDDEKPAVRIGDLLVFVYVAPDAAGRPVLRLTVDTEDAATSPAVLDDHVKVELHVNDARLYDAMVRV
jgi:hypothetical protein